MNALGMIETRGLIPAIEACDVMLKTANVQLIGKRKSTASLVSILITGDVGAVKASVEAGAAAAEKVSAGSVLASHVIPRPIREIEKVFGPKNGLNYSNKKPEGGNTGNSGEGNEPITTSKEQADSNDESRATDIPSSKEPKAKTKKEDVIELPIVEELDKEVLDEMMTQFDMPVVMMNVRKLSVPKLRKLARQYDDLGIVGRQVSRANKKNLLKHFEDYYSRQQ